MFLACIYMSFSSSSSPAVAECDPTQFEEYYLTNHGEDDSMDWLGDGPFCDLAYDSSELWSGWTTPGITRYWPAQ